MVRWILCLLIAAASSCVALAQTASLHGQVSDESGAVIPGAKITLQGSSGTRTTKAANDGSYSFSALAPGNYTAQAIAPELSLPQPAAIVLKPGAQTLNLQLKVSLTTQQVTVRENAGPVVTTDSANNASALVLRGEDLQALSDDPDDLQADLIALAGPSAGPNGGAFYIDGFSGGQIPAKESIREIRINQNPFSPEYDKLGFGRIEIFTKPGTEKFHGTGFYNFGDSFWNTRNPYAQRKAPFLLKEYGGNVSGPINGRTSFFLDIQRHEVDNGSIVNGITLDPATLGIVDPFTDVFRTPQRRIAVSPRVDYQLNANNTLVMRYVFSDVDIRGSGIGSFNLISRGAHFQDTSHTVQITETAVLGKSVVNETRFQFFRIGGSTAADKAGPAIQVLGSFNGGGSPVGRQLNSENDYEFQNYTSVVRAAHVWRFGVRLRGKTIDNTAPQNFNGTFTFGGGLAPVLDVNDQPVPDANGQPKMAPIQSIERYRRTLLFQQRGLTPLQIRALGGGATQFTIGGGDPEISAGQMDAGLFAGDDWRVRPNLTLSLGLRYETQTNIHDWHDFAPRIGIAWAPGGSSGKSRPKTVLRAGFGTFYDRFNIENTLTALRYNGVVQQQYTVADPDFFPVIPPLASLGALRSTRTIQEVGSTLRAPYIMQSALGIERQLPRNTTVAVTYANSHGVHMLRSQALLRNSGPLFLMESSGIYNQNQLIVNVNSRVNQKTSIFGSYMFNRALSDTDGITTFPANPYSFAGEYGPAATDVHHRMVLGGSLETKWKMRLSPLFVVESGPPFDITAGRDIYGDTLFNGRPGIATDPGKTGLILTRYGLLDPNPTPDERILTRNFGRGPGSVALNLRMARAFAFGPSRETAVPAFTGPGSGGGDARRVNGGAFGNAGIGQGSGGTANRRYNLSISMSIRNLLNHNNPGPIIGNITSPLFGQANQPAGNSGGLGFSEAANNRRLELQMRLNF